MSYSTWTGVAGWCGVGLGWLANASGRSSWSGLCNVRYSETGKKGSWGQHLLV